MSSCLSFPSSARPLFSRFLSSVGVRVYTLQNVELDETWSLRTGHAAVNQRLRSILPKHLETASILHSFNYHNLNIGSFLAVGILFLQLKQENNRSSKNLGKKTDLLGLQLGHWTLVLGSAEQTNVCVLTHWNQKHSLRTSNKKILHVFLFTWMKNYQTS